MITEADARGGRINGQRVRWDTLRPAERLRLVAPGGGSALLAVRSTGGPFTAWPTVFARTAARIRQRWEPRFPHVHPRTGCGIPSRSRRCNGWWAATISRPPGW